MIPDKTLPRHPSAPPVARQPAFQPEKADDKLSADELAFINLAKSDPAGAMAWARAKYPASGPLFTFLQSAVRALADRNLPAAEKVLAHAEGGTHDVFQGVFASRLSRDFAGAVRWADEWNLANPALAQAPFLSYLNHDSGEWRPDARQALAVSKSPLVRENLIHMEAQRLMAEDEAGLVPLAETLTGEERLRVLEYHVSVLLIRGDERAREALRSIRPQRLHEIGEMVLRDPVMILDYHMAQPANPGVDQLFSSASQLLADWEREDPEAAGIWTARYTERQFFDHGMIRASIRKRKENGK